MKLSPSIFLLLLLPLLSSCKKTDDEANQLESKILVEGYVFAGEPVKIRAATLNENGSSISAPAENALVKLIQGNLEIPFSENDTIPGTYTQMNSGILLADTGLVEMSLTYKGNLHQSHSRFPPKISGLEISTTDIELLPGDGNTTVATISWNLIPGASGYCIFARSQAQYPVIQLNNTLYDAQHSLFSKIHYENVINLKTTDFAYVGNYDIYVTAIGSEFMAMYNGYGLSNLITAPSNIENGWGVFTAFNGQSVSVTVH